MKASELIREITELMSEQGDLDVGIINQEFNSFDAISLVWFKQAETEADGIYGDDVSEASYFIAIE